MERAVKDIDAWCDREARRALSRPTLAEALLAGRGWAYVSYRTRYLLARLPIRVSLHVAEVWMLGFLFPVEELGPIFATRALMAVCASLWWGALEPLREDVRESARRRAWSNATETIRAWLARSVEVGLAQLGIAVAWILFARSEFTSFSIFDAYALAAGLRLLLETVARTYAAGIGALRRVPRPFWSGLPGDVVDLAGALLLWPWLGPWGFAVALLAGGVVRAWLVVVYARRAYRLSPLRGLRVRGRRKKARPLGFGAVRRAVPHALGNSAAQLDAWILLALAAAAESERAALIVAAFHVLRPVLSASVGWTRLFYFDFKMLEVRGRLLQERFESLLRRLALGLAIVTGALLLSLWPLLWNRMPDAEALWLVVFLILRSVFALNQVQAFSYGRTRYLLGTAGAVALGLVVMPWVPFLRDNLLAAVTVMIGAVTLVAPRPIRLRTLPVGRAAPLTRASDEHEPHVVGLYQWLGELTAFAGPAQVFAAFVPNRLSVSVHRVAAELSRKHGVATTVWGARHVLWFENAGEGALNNCRERLITTAAGCLSTLRLGPRAESGRAALARAIEDGVLEAGLARRLRAVEMCSPEELAEAFRRTFPQGVLVDAHRGRLTAAGARSGERVRQAAIVMRQAMTEVLRAARGPGGRSARDVPGYLSVFSPCGEPEVVFVLPSDVASADRIAWRRRVEDASLAASMSVAGLGPRLEAVGAWRKGTAARVERRAAGEDT